MQYDLIPSCVCILKQHSQKIKKMNIFHQYLGSDGGKSVVDQQKQRESCKLIKIL